MNRDEILAADDMQIQTVVIPEWGGPVYMRTLSGAAARHVQKIASDSVEGTADEIDVAVALLVRCICAGPDDGTLVFTPEDGPAVAEKSVAVINRLSKIAMRQNHMDADSQEATAEN